MHNKPWFMVIEMNWNTSHNLMTSCELSKGHRFESPSGQELSTLSDCQKCIRYEPNIGQRVPPRERHPCFITKTRIANLRIKFCTQNCKKIVFESNIFPLNIKEKLHTALIWFINIFVYLNKAVIIQLARILDPGKFMSSPYLEIVLTLSGNQRLQLNNFCKILDRFRKKLVWQKLIYLCNNQQIIMYNQKEILIVFSVVKEKNNNYFSRGLFQIDFTL